MKGGCHCGAVTVEVPGRPDYLNQCNCTLCAKLGALWGYYPDDAVTVAGSPRDYRRADVDPPTIAAQFCGTCGATIRWAPTEHSASRRTGVNMRLFAPAALVGVEVRYGDRRNYPSAEPREYYRAPEPFDGDGPTP